MQAHRRAAAHLHCCQRSSIPEGVSRDAARAASRGDCADGPRRIGDGGGDGGTALGQPRSMLSPGFTLSQEVRRDTENRDVTALGLVGVLQTTSNSVLALKNALGPTPGGHSARPRLRGRKHSVVRWRRAEARGGRGATPVGATPATQISHGRARTRRRPPSRNRHPCPCPGCKGCGAADRLEGCVLLLFCALAERPPRRYMKVLWASARRGEGYQAVEVAVAAAGGGGMPISRETEISEAHVLLNAAREVLWKPAAAGLGGNL